MKGEPAPVPFFMLSLGSIENMGGASLAAHVNPQQRSRFLQEPF